MGTTAPTDEGRATTADEAARQYFAPVLDHGRGWVLMPDAERDLSHEEKREVWLNLGDVGREGEDVDQPHQLGRIDGEPVIVDYGRGEFFDQRQS